MIPLVLFLATVAVFSSQAQAAVVLTLDVYYESQCPYCRNFFVNQLRPSERVLRNYLSVNLVPAGNARIEHQGGQTIIRCQHGESECLLNQIHACGIKRIADDSSRVFFASCLFDHYLDPIAAGRKCSPEFGLDWSDVSQCAKGEEGKTMQIQNIKDTQAVKKFGVPFVAVDKYTGDDHFQEELDSELKIVLCRLLKKKGVIPEACT